VLSSIELVWLLPNVRIADTARYSKFFLLLLD
jgi:hypothetical protein